MDTNEYIKLADVEDRMWYFRALHAHVLGELRRAFPEMRPLRVLDAGCGTGGLIRRAACEEPAWALTGLDHSPLACALARKRCAAQIEEGSVTSLPFSEAVFDGIASADVLYQIERPAEALAEFRRCLKPGGVVVINVPAYRWLWSYHDEMVHSKHRFRRSKIVELLEEGGFRVERATYWNMLPFPLVVLRRKLWRIRGSGDVKMSPQPVEAAFRAAMALERVWLRTGARLPFGSSVLAVGRLME